MKIEDLDLFADSPDEAECASHEVADIIEDGIVERAIPVSADEIAIWAGYHPRQRPIDVWIRHISGDGGEKEETLHQGMTKNFVRESISFMPDHIFLDNQFLYWGEGTPEFIKAIMGAERLLLGVDTQDAIFTSYAALISGNIRTASFEIPVEMLERLDAAKMDLESHIASGDPPPPDGSERYNAFLSAYSRHTAHLKRSCEPNDEMISLATEYQEINKAIKAAESLKKVITQKVHESLLALDAESYKSPFGGFYLREAGSFRKDWEMATMGAVMALPDDARDAFAKAIDWEFEQQKAQFDAKPKTFYPHPTPPSKAKGEATPPGVSKLKGKAASALREAVSQSLDAGISDAEYCDITSSPVPSSPTDDILDNF